MLSYVQQGSTKLCKQFISASQDMIYISILISRNDEVSRDMLRVRLYFYSCPRSDLWWGLTELCFKAKFRNFISLLLLALIKYWPVARKWVVMDILWKSSKAQITYKVSCYIVIDNVYPTNARSGWDTHWSCLKRCKDGNSEWGQSLET